MGVLKVLFEVEPYNVPLNSFRAVQGFFILQRKRPHDAFPEEGEDYENHTERQHP